MLYDGDALCVLGQGHFYLLKNDESENIIFVIKAVVGKDNGDSGYYRIDYLLIGNTMCER